MVIDHTFPNDISLAHFEAIDGARSAMLRCKPSEEARAESALFTALIDLLGYSAANDIPDLGIYADELILNCLIGNIPTIDGE